MQQSEALHNIVDILVIPQSVGYQHPVVASLRLTPSLVQKIQTAQHLNARSVGSCRLTVDDEKELAMEMLFYRHQFTELLFEHPAFQQAALSVLQNSYLFKQRKIFFSSEQLFEDERVTALQFFSGPKPDTLPLTQTLQHIVLSRVWRRLLTVSERTCFQTVAFRKLVDCVGHLNALRNAYVVLTTALVRQLTACVSQLYQQSITSADAQQIGSFGIMRAAYRYHPSSGVRFSTYAANWIRHELQRQALSNRLIRVSSSMVEKFAAAKEHGTREQEMLATTLLRLASVQVDDRAIRQWSAHAAETQTNPEVLVERRETTEVLNRALTRLLSPKCQDIIQRRFGISKTSAAEESVAEIAGRYGVTRGSIYQLEQTALKKLHKHLTSQT